MESNELNQNKSETLNFEQPETKDIKLTTDISNLDEQELPKKHKCKISRKFSAGSKLIFWSLMLVLTLILGTESFMTAVKYNTVIADHIEAGEMGSAVFKCFAAIFLWIEALFYVVIFSWSVYGTINNGIKFTKAKKAKKALKEEKEPKAKKEAKKNEKTKKIELKKEDNSIENKKEEEIKK